MIKIRKTYFPLVALILGIIPIAIVAMGRFTWSNNHQVQLSETYEITTMMFALFLYGPCIIRNFIKDDSIDCINLMIHIENIFTFCIFISLFLTDASQKAVSSMFGGIFPQISSEFILICAILLSWLGLPAVAGYAWIIAGFTMITTLLKNSSLLGTSGAIMVLVFFLSILIQLYVNNFGIDDLKDITNQFASVSKHSNKIRGDINSSISSTKSAVGKFLK